MRAEDHLQLQVSKYLTTQYPSVIFRFDLSAGAHTSMQMAMRNKRMNPHQGYPDLIILKPKGKYGALFIELKVKSPYKKNGVDLLSNEHFQRQDKMHKKLIESGYYATFGVGFQQVKNIIDNYLSLR